MNQTRFDKFLPRGGTQWVIVAGFCLYLTAEIVTLFFPPLDPLNPTGASWLIFQCGDAAFLVAVTATIADSTRRIRLNGPSWKNVTVLTTTGLIAIVLLSLSVYNHYTFSQRLKNLEPNEKVLRSLAETLSKPGLTPVSRSRLSILNAKMFFLDHGKTTYYFKTDGQQALYEPTSAEKVFRKNIILAKTQLESGKSAMLRAVCLWFAAIVVGVFLGFFVLTKQKRP